MVVQVVRQVVGNQVFARHADVHRVPVLELPPKPLQALFGDVGLRERRRLEEDEVPHVSGHLLRPAGQKQRKRQKKKKEGSSIGLKEG